MDKKKLGLINKSKLEIRKTVGGGTVKQSFSHGRVKSVAVEVKKVRTFDKNPSVKKQKEKSDPDQSSSIVNKTPEKINNSASEDIHSQNSNKEKLEKIKQAAHSNKIDMENNISSRQEEGFRNKKFQEKKIKQTQLKMLLKQIKISNKYNA